MRRRAAPLVQEWLVAGGWCRFPVVVLDSRVVHAHCWLRFPAARGTLFGPRAAFRLQSRPVVPAGKESCGFCAKAVVSLTETDLGALAAYQVAGLSATSFPGPSLLRSIGFPERFAPTWKAVDFATVRLRQEQRCLKQATNASVRPRVNVAKLISSEIPCTVPACAILEKAFGPALPVSTKLTAAINSPSKRGLAAHSL